ncbi:transposase [Streptomyces sp. NPDC029674]|uniref:IS110 family transposase n=1 Tax=Streptomyces sp. NPDC029674 TaxID=3365297 RepID=UPI00384EDC72
MILGVDTHKDVHVAAVITVLGVLLAHQKFPATAVGYRQLLSWARSFGALRRAGVECTGSYGAALARFLSRENVQVVEVNQPDRAMRRERGKTDAVDAEAAPPARSCPDALTSRPRPARARRPTCAYCGWQRNRPSRPARRRRTSSRLCCSASIPRCARRCPS